MIINSTDFIKELAINEFQKEHPDADIPQKGIDKAIFVITISFVVGIFIDVVFRYLVIESLYQSYKEQAKPADTV